MLSASQLFDGDLPAHTYKSLLVAEIEPILDLTQWSKESTIVSGFFDKGFKHLDGTSAPK